MPVLGALSIRNMLFLGMPGVLELAPN
jgi:hypothetical protein